MSAKVTLTIVEPNQKRQTHVFENRTTCVVGRADECNIKLTDQLVSRHH